MADKRDIDIIGDGKNVMRIAPAAHFDFHGTRKQSIITDNEGISDRITHSKHATLL